MLVISGWIFSWILCIVSALYFYPSINSTQPDISAQHGRQVRLASMFMGLYRRASSTLPSWPLVPPKWKGFLTRWFLIGSCFLTLLFLQVLDFFIVKLLLSYYCCYHSWNVLSIFPMLSNFCSKAFSFRAMSCSVDVLWESGTLSVGARVMVRTGKFKVLSTLEGILRPWGWLTFRQSIIVVVTFCYYFQLLLLDFHAYSFFVHYWLLILPVFRYSYFLPSIYTSFTI